MELFNGLRVYVSNHLTVRKQVRHPRSKRKRVRKKWRRDPRNWSEAADPSVFVSEGAMFCHPSTLAALRSHSAKHSHSRAR